MKTQPCCDAAEKRSHASEVLLFPRARLASAPMMQQRRRTKLRGSHHAEGDVANGNIGGSCQWKRRARGNAPIALVIVKRKSGLLQLVSAPNDNTERGKVQSIATLPAASHVFMSQTVVTAECIEDCVAQLTSERCWLVSSWCRKRLVSETELQSRHYGHIFVF